LDSNSLCYRGVTYNMDGDASPKDLEFLHDWFDGVVKSVFSVFGPSSKDVVTTLEGLVGHRCGWVGKPQQLRAAMRERYGLVGDVLVTLLFEEAVKQSFRLGKSERHILLRLIGAGVDGHRCISQDEVA